MNLQQAVRAIRKEAVVKDEPLKALRLCELFKDKVELSDELFKTSGMLRHFFDPKEWTKSYDIPVNDCESIEPVKYARDAGPRYLRYQWLLDNLKKDNAKSYLDLGCYIGSLVTTASLMGIEAYGVDNTTMAIETARRRNEQVEGKAKFFVGDAQTFSEQKVEHVSAFEIIEHVLDPKAFVENMLNLGKICYISTPDGPYRNGEGNIAMGWEWKGEKDYRGHVRVFTQATMKELLKDCEILFLQTFSDGLLHVKFRRKGNNA
jgi:SAM-dependent methyltransferase